MRISGILAWFLWRSVYLFKLPTWSRRFKVALDWTWDLLFPRDLSFLNSDRRTISLMPTIVRAISFNGKETLQGLQRDGGRAGGSLVSDGPNEPEKVSPCLGKGRLFGNGRADREPPASDFRLPFSITLKTWQGLLG